MLPSEYEEQNCAIARSLEVVGERWTMLIVRDAMLGIRRFEDFQARLGTSRTVLTARLSQLVERGVLERVLYQHRPDRYEYVLTERGVALWPVLIALAQWGQPLTSTGAPRIFRHHSCASPVHGEVRCPDCGEQLVPDDVLSVPRAGAELTRAEHIAPSVRDALEHERTLLDPVRD